MEPPYTKMEFIAAGGSRKENATQFTPASDLAWKIEVNANRAHLGRLSAASCQRCGSLGSSGGCGGGSAFGAAGGGGGRAD